VRFGELGGSGSGTVVIPILESDSQAFVSCYLNLRRSAARSVAAFSNQYLQAGTPAAPA
jgi:hypothetical protein